MAYFDLFQYPVTGDEIRQYACMPMHADEIKESLQQLIQQGLLFRHQQFYLLENRPELVARRIAGNRRAVDLMQTAARVSDFLYRFPFVRMIGVSGSLSKQFADEESDIDFFIITAKNRLWIARTLLHVYKKFTYLRGRQHWHCMNYFIDAGNLAIKEKNIFTAMETATLIPMAGKEMHSAFLEENHWAFEYFPNLCSSRQEHAPDDSPSLLKRCAELIFGLKIFNRVEQKLWRITADRWRKKETTGALNKKGMRMSLITGKHYARPNPQLFQRRILRAYRDKIEELEELRLSAVSTK